eukprot:XP_011451203.1 PREDICTED: uncharacterized protein LOC105344963 [Crassostrea gigas]
MDMTRDALILILCLLIGKTANENALIKNVTDILNTAKALDNGNGSFVDKINNVGNFAEKFTEMIAPALLSLRAEKMSGGEKSANSLDSRLLKNLMIEVDREFKGLSVKLENLIHKMEEHRIQMQLGNTEQKIRVAAQELEILHSVPADAFSEQGVNVEMSYLIVKNYSESYKYMKHDWGQKIKQVTNHITQIDQVVKSKWREQAEADVIQMAETKRGLDHYSFVHLMYNHLQNKYPWRHWFAVVYDPIDGPDKHWMSTCGGFTLFRFHGRNIVVASVDENKPYMDRKKGVDILENLPPSTTAEGFYYSLPGNITGTCDWYASSGCLRFGYKGFHVGNGKRTVLVTRDDSDMTLHLFG